MSRPLPPRGSLVPPLSASPRQTIAPPPPDALALLQRHILGEEAPAPDPKQPFTVHPGGEAGARRIFEGEPWNPARSDWFRLGR